ncbi:hypothetical protein TcasGA2_TC034104 [Tribolium castaneum]|uniref:Integrase catalytic domain-containing protein n=1 Tax=Tribolium castaneum TaxID=7070 RepID=A0A139WDH3_TRICA|nr:hypothetical protein TcasGA2_TC034104 [Tribolium castaneum]
MTDDKNKESPKEIIPQSGQEFLNLETILQLVKAAVSEALQAQTGTVAAAAAAAAAVDQEVAGSPDIQELSRDKEASGTLGSSGNGVVSETSGLQNSLPLGRVEAPGASRNMGYCVMPDLTQSLRVFNGKGGASDALQWLQDIKTMAGRQFWGDAILLEVARQHLVDSALLWYRYHQDTLTTWAAFEMRFRENYTDRRTLAESKTPRGRQPGMLHPLDKGSTPFQVVHIDHLGPFPSSKTGNKYVCAIIDGFSKYTVLKALPDVGAEGTLSFLKEFVSNYGKPNKIISDRGTAFISKLFEKFCGDCEIQHVKIATASPRSNGQVEKVNDVIITCLSTSTDDIEGSDWDEKLSEVQWAINNATHSVTKRTPFSLVRTYTRDGFTNNPLAAEIRDLNTRLNTEEEQNLVADRLKRNADRMCANFNKSRRQARVFKQGDLVLVRAEVPSTGQSRKLSPKYRGPYEIVKFIGNDRYLVQDIEGEQQTGEEERDRSRPRSTAHKETGRRYHRLIGDFHIT